jgi:hypothetical protein
VKRNRIRRRREPLLPPVQPVLASIGRPQPTESASSSEVGDRVLAAIVTSMRGPEAGWTSDDLAARLELRPLSHERRALEDALRSMKVRGLMRYEFLGRGISMPWYLTERGIEAARALETGVSGAPRH